MKTGYIKAQEVVESLKASKTADKVKDAEETAIVKSQLDAVRANPDLAAMYNSHASAGAENLGGTLPTLSIYTVGKSKNILATGKKPDDGYFFYAPTKEQFQEVNVHIVTISHGFYALDMNGGKKFNQIMGGVVITEDGKNLPFVMFIRGIRLKNLWAFGKEAGKYTHAKPVSIPMFTLTIQLTAESESTKFGDNWNVQFQIQEDGPGIPKVVTDEGEFQFLLDMVDVIEETVEKIIESKNVPDEEAKPTRIESTAPTPERDPEPF